ncbi:MAG: hypothetical protein LBN26_06605 [Christensenellaceae bacterium]|nr:hypothetical protein [Christensenellaceae bacterium]
MTKAITAILLFTGQEGQMRSKKPLELHEVCGLSLCDWALRAVEGTIAVDPICLTKPSDGGEAQALLDAVSQLPASAGYVLILQGNLPLISSDTLKRLAGAAEGHDAARLTGAGGQLCGCYCCSIQALRALRGAPAGADAAWCIQALGEDVVRVQAPELECLAVLDRASLAACTRVCQRGINAGHMAEGVTLIDPEHTYIGADVRIGMDTVLYPGVILQGSTSIGENCTLYEGCRLEDVTVGEGCTLQAVVAQQAQIDADTSIGPFVRLRPNAHIGKGCKIGNFVEVKNSTLGAGGKVAHLTYVGDADIGERINIGCGSVFVNYDGQQKHRTTVGDDVFLGCQTALVAPVQVGDGAYTAAGSTITEDVPDGALGIARARQVNKAGWVAKKRGR